MKISDTQIWIENFYKERGWSSYGPFERIAFLAEEVGETARAVRAIEIGRDRPDESVESAEKLRENLVEELGDVLGNVFSLAAIYKVTVEEMLSAHKDKLNQRFSQE